MYIQEHAHVFALAVHSSPIEFSFWFLKARSLLMFASLRQGWPLLGGTAGPVRTTVTRWANAQGRTSRLMHFAEQQRVPGGSMAPWEVRWNQPLFLCWWVGLVWVGWVFSWFMFIHVYSGNRYIWIPNTIVFPHAWLPTGHFFATALSRCCSKGCGRLEMLGIETDEFSSAADVIRTWHTQYHALSDSARQVNTYESFAMNAPGNGQRRLAQAMRKPRSSGGKLYIYIYIIIYIHIISHYII